MSFWSRLENYGDSIALITEQEKISYSSLACISDKISERIPERSLVFLICNNQIASIAAYLGFLRKRIVPILISSSIDKESYERLVQIYRPQYIWCPENFSNDTGTYQCREYKLISTRYDTSRMDDNLAILITTSGSTGSPKLVRLSYNNLVANTKSIVSYLDIKSGDRAITTLPMSYVYGLSIIQTHLDVGASIIVTEKNFFDRDFWTFFNKHEATNFGTVPYVYKMLDKLSFSKLDLPSLRYATQAGGRLGAELQTVIGKGLIEKGRKFIVMYGASEATARMSYVPDEKTIEKAGSIGVPIPGGRFELIDTDGSLVCESEKIGELVYYGQNVMLGYANSREDLILGDEMQGRLETGDLAKRDADGYYYIVGRKSRFIKIYGNRINLDEVEDLLATKGYEVACVGEDDHLKVYSTVCNIDDIASYISRKIGINRRAFNVIHIDAIPRNNSGKTLYSELV